MAALPILSSALLTQGLRGFYSDRRKHYLVAVYGTGQSEELTLELTATGSQKPLPKVRVIPVASELELRQRMPSVEEALPCIAFLVPFTEDLPSDLAGRFANNGRVLRFGPERQLAALFGAEGCSGEAAESKLGRYLLEVGDRSKSYSAGETRLTLRGLWNAYLKTELGVPVDGGLGRDTFLAWIGITQVPAWASELFTAEATKALQQELEAHLKGSLGELEVLLWRAWLRGEGPKALQLATLFEVLTQSDDEAVRMWVHERAVQLFGAGQAAQAAAHAAVLGQTAAPARKWLGRQRQLEWRLQELCVAAESHVTHPTVRQALRDSTVLPSAWQERLGTLGDALRQGAEEPTPKRAQQAIDAFTGLRQHEQFSSEDLTQAEMATRLLAWLSSNPTQQLQAGPAAHADAELLARWYAEQGGYVDLARLSARTSVDTRLGAGIQAVLERVDTLRAELDERFAKSLVDWIQVDRKSKTTLPIDRALERIAVPFLQQDTYEKRKLLVILMDGMAWSQAIELLESVERRVDHWGVLAWHGELANRVGSGAYPPVLANLPTTTEVSRSAFFAGRPMKDGEALDTSADPKRFEGNKLLHPFCSTDTAPRLLLKGEGHAQSGVASAEALALIDDDRRRIVSVVINAIDASLASDSQQRQRWTVDNIKSLPTLLERAKTAGRFVLLASDHGHVPSVRFRKALPVVQVGGQRWRPWRGEQDTLRPGELRLRGSGVYCPKNVEEIVVLIRDDETYSSTPCAGQHGGATLAEVVTPCLLLGPDAEIAHGWTGEHLPLRPRVIPEWWSLMVPAAVAPSRSSPPAKRVAKVPNPGQPYLPGVEVAPIEPESSVSGSGHAADALEKKLSSNKLIKAQAQDKSELIQEVARAVAFLVERGGTVPLEALANPLGIDAYRVRGKIPHLQRVLNLDGYAILAVNDPSKQISLNIEMFAQQFGVTL